MQKSLLSVVICLNERMHMIILKLHVSNSTYIKCLNPDNFVSVTFQNILFDFFDISSSHISIIESWRYPNYTSYKKEQSTSRCLKIRYLSWDIRFQVVIDETQN